MSKDEYVIINKSKLLKRIEEVQKAIQLCTPEQRLLKDLLIQEFEIRNQILSQSTPLIPEIKKAVLEGVNSIHFENDGSHWTDNNVVEDYISNLKLDI